MNRNLKVILGTFLTAMSIFAFEYVKWANTISGPVFNDVASGGHWLPPYIQPIDPTLLFLFLVFVAVFLVSGVYLLVSGLFKW